MHARVAVQPLQRRRDVDELLVLGLLVLQLLKLGLVFQAPLHRQRVAIDQRRQVARKLIQIRKRQPHHPAHVFDGALGRQRAEGDDLTDVALAVLLRDVLDHLVAPVHAKVDIEVGHRHALGV